MAHNEDWLEPPAPTSRPTISAALSQPEQLSGRSHAQARESDPGSGRLGPTQRGFVAGPPTLALKVSAPGVPPLPRTTGPVSDRALWAPALTLVHSKVAGLRKASKLSRRLALREPSMLSNTTRRRSAEGLVPTNARLVVAKHLWATASSTGSVERRRDAVVVDGRTGSELRIRNDIHSGTFGRKRRPRRCAVRPAHATREGPSHRHRSRPPRSTRSTDRRVIRHSRRCRCEATAARWGATRWDSRRGPRRGRRSRDLTCEAGFAWPVLSLEPPSR